MPLRRAIVAIALALATAIAFGSPSACEFAQAEPPRTFAEAELEGASLRYHGNVPIVILSGTPAEMGRQHAALMAAQAREVLKFPKQFAAEFGVEFLWPVMTHLGALLMKNAPERYQQELAALAAGGDLDPGALAVGNTLLELRRVGCSVLIVDPKHSATGGPLFGRNFDFPTLGELDKYSAVLVYRTPGRRAFASIAFPTAVGVVSGMNDAGLAVATLDVYRSGDDSLKFDAAGTPLALVFRRILEECTTVAEAEKLLRSEHATTWMNLAACDRDGAAVFEITPSKIGRRDPEAGVLACTNHFRTAGLAVDDHCWRYPRLAEAARLKTLGVDDVRERLHAANQGDITLQTMVFEPRTLTLHLAIGEPPTSDDPLTAIPLAPLFQAPPEDSAPGAAP